MTGYIFLFIALVMNGAANTLLKLAASKLDPAQPLIPQVVVSWPLILGVVAFVINTGFYFLALRTLPLSVAYPIMIGMAFLIVSTASVFVFRETIIVTQYIGFVLIIAGLALASIR